MPDAIDHGSKSIGLERDGVVEAGPRAVEREMLFNKLRAGGDRERGRIDAGEAIGKSDRTP